jgi:predicted DCC family thiol-disulfide oxidoreductase YuxK
MKPKNIILFDGVCNFCSDSVSFILSRDPKENFCFASMQSEPGQKLLEAHGLPKNDFKSFVLIVGDKHFKKSTAALKVAAGLSGFWPLLSVLEYIPPRIRDFGYDLIANNRYTLFGTKSECMVPSAEVRSRFL